MGELNRLPDDITTYLARMSRGDAEADRIVTPHVYRELRAIAKSVRFRFQGLETLNTTAVIHEAYLKIMKGQGGWQSRSHFYCVAAKAMRQILLNTARDKQRLKRGGAYSIERFEEFGEYGQQVTMSSQAAEKLIDFDELLRKLEEKDGIYGRIVECRFYAGMSIEETAEALHISPATVKRKWQLARDWLFSNLSAFN